MAVEVALNTPLAEALSNVVQPKLSEVGWSTGGLDDSALGEYIILMLVNGKTQEQIAAELSNDLLSLPPDDTGAVEFARWLFEQVEILNNRLNGIPQAQPSQVTPSYQEDSRLSKSDNGHPIDGGGMDTDMGEGIEAAQNGVIPTGPRSMRNRSQNGAQRMAGQISKAMDRSGDAVLHRVRSQQGTERINMHNRPPPKGPRNDLKRMSRVQPNGRNMGAPNGMMQDAGPAAALLHMSPQQQMAMMSMYEGMMQQFIAAQQQQNVMPGMVQPGLNPGFPNGGSGPPPGRSLFERVEGHPQQQHSKFNQRRRENGAGFHPNAKTEPVANVDNTASSFNEDISSSMEVESSQTKSPEETPCTFNLKCTKQDCPYAHQSPAAPAGTTIDVSDTCPFGAACQNRKCVGRHPSPAQKLSHKSQQDCKFYPNCTNTMCPFRHPTLPMCRNGADCKTEGCKFTHVKTMCKFNPCLNPQCPYKHAEGQKRGKFGDKVWIADGDDEKEHVSERKFVDDEMAEEELVVPDMKLGDVKAEEQANRSQTSSVGVIT